MGRQFWYLLILSNALTDFPSFAGTLLHIFLTLTELQFYFGTFDVDRDVPSKLNFCLSCRCFLAVSVTLCTPSACCSLLFLPQSSGSGSREGNIHPLNFALGTGSSLIFSTGPSEGLNSPRARQIFERIPALFQRDWPQKFGSFFSDHLTPNTALRELAYGRADGERIKDRPVEEVPTG